MHSIRIRFPRRVSTQHTERYVESPDPDKAVPVDPSY